MNNKDKYDKVFIDCFSVDKVKLEKNLEYNSITQWDSVGHMSMIAALEEAFDIVFEMDEINSELEDVDVVLVVGANDIVNPSALNEPDSPIAGMPVLEVWKASTVVVLKRGMASGYAGVDNPLFFNENTMMLFGDAKQSLDSVLSGLS